MNLINFNKIKHLLFSVFIILLINSCAEKNPSPKITLTTKSLSFAETKEMSYSKSQSIELSANDLSSEINITVSDNFQISLDDINFVKQVPIKSTDANSKNTKIYIRFSPLKGSVTKISGNLSIENSELQTINVALDGIGIPTDLKINVNPLSLSFNNTMVSKHSDSLSIVISGASLKSVIELNVSDNFELSLDNNIYSNKLQIDLSSVNNSNTIYLRFSPNIAGNITESLTLKSLGAEEVKVKLSGIALARIHNYTTFVNEELGFGDGLKQSTEQSFNLHTDLSNIETIKMYLQINCPSTGCDDWDRFANIKVKDKTSGNWFEIGRYITPYWTGTQELERGLEFDVTDFKSLLTGNSEIKIYIENWTTKVDIVSLDFDYIEGSPDYSYYAVSEVLNFHANSISGVPYGISHNLDLDKSIELPDNTEAAHLRTIISGWGHATPNDLGGRGCAEWCFRTHDIKINGNNTFQHDLTALDCASNPISNQAPGNWKPDRAGWCPGMVVPSRIDNLDISVFNSSFTFEYDYEDWTSDNRGGNAFYATSTYIIVKSNTLITPALIND